VLAVVYSQINAFPAIVIQTLIGLTLLTTVASAYDYLVEERSRRAARHSGKQA